MPKVVILNDASVARGGATGLALLQARLLRARGLAVVFASADRGAGPRRCATSASRCIWRGRSR
ncbi:hypothetical protein ACTTAM_08565 [Rhodobacter capsulatus]|uniref:hypothetical protein n=1 Tax=Rhodobacter capsulatus TaxID=1061 RepID=UPI004027A6D2